MAKDSEVGSNKQALFFLDWDALEYQRTRLLLSRKTLCDTVKISMNTLKQIENGEGIYPVIANKLATLFQCFNFELLSAKDPQYRPPLPPAASMSNSPEWVMESTNRQGGPASNGLHYVVCRMKHQHTANRLGRGKFYVLTGVPLKLRAEWQDKLARHADVCVRVGMHRNIATNLMSTPVPTDAGWWVIDEWVGEETLKEKLIKGVWPISSLPQLLLDVVSGLQAMHFKKVVFRELNPARILISDSDKRAVLTDFELGKLLDGSRSVSSDWPEDPFRAPEVDGTQATVQSDFYSLAKVAIAVAARDNLSAQKTAKEIFDEAGIPKSICKILLMCLKPVASERPKDLAPLQKELTRWAEKTKR